MTGIFKLDVRFFSGYYISTMIAYFFMSIEIFKTIIVDFATLVRSGLDLAGITIDQANPGGMWLVFYISIIIFTLIIQYTLVYKIGFQITNNFPYKNNIEKALVCLLFFGFQIYTTNQLFEQPMPEQVPDFFVKLMGGYENTLGLQINQVSVSEQNVASVIPFIWYAGPIIYLLYKGFAAPEEEVRNE